MIWDIVSRMSQARKSLEAGMPHFNENVVYKDRLEVDLEPTKELIEKKKIVFEDIKEDGHVENSGSLKNRNIER